MILLTTCRRRMDAPSSERWCMDLRILDAGASKPHVRVWKCKYLAILLFCILTFTLTIDIKESSSIKPGATNNPLTGSPHGPGQIHILYTDPSLVPASLDKCKDLGNEIGWFMLDLMMRDDKRSLVSANHLHLHSRLWARDHQTM